METMKIAGKDYNIIGAVKSETTRGLVSLVDIQLMSDERWMELANSSQNQAKLKKFGLK